jgi:predicted transposase/invertase (TIGR01784 family)
LPKIKKLNREPQNALEEWFIYLNDVQGGELEVIAMSNPAIRKALSIEEIFKADAQERRLYEMREKAFLDEISNVEVAKAEKKAKGILMAQDAICQFLEVRFGAESQPLQDTVRSITDLNVFSRIMYRIFIVNKLDEAKALIHDSLISQ